MGYRRAETPDAATGHKTAVDDEPYPVDVFGEPNPIPDNKLGKYLTDDVFYYIDVYENNKTFGFPYKDWTQMPRWLVELHKTFLRIENEFENWRISQSHN